MGTEYGARLERGLVLEARETGYVVRSLDRDGIVTPAIPAMGSAAFGEGDKVIFFLFRDGTGMIVCGTEAGDR